MTQRENPEGMKVLERFRAEHPAALVSGARIENFREGWAVEIMPGGGVAHHFQRDTFSEARAKCGIYAQTRWLHGQG